ncbi:MAG: transcriptional regulator [Muribaculaceae bacterium]
MINTIDILKGLHPGLYLKRELSKRQLKSGHFAESIGEHPQTLSAIIRGRRAMNVPLSLRIENALGMEEGLLMTLQVYYDIDMEKRKQSRQCHPDLSKFRPALFWDTSIDSIDFVTNSRFVINRVMQRGNEEEIRELLRFYGREKILAETDRDNKSLFMATVIKNMQLLSRYE